jgi:GNAT superfamily N-acetyltransferase
MSNDIITVRGVISRPCFQCGALVEGDGLEAYGYAGLAHVRAAHADTVPFPDMAVRNYFEGEARMTGGAERLDAIGAVEIHPVTADRIEDFLAFMDYDAMVGVPQNSACYCLEPHEVKPGEVPPMSHWSERRETMAQLLRDGVAYGYLAYVDGRPAGWVNASKRGDCTMFARADAEDATTVSVPCFAIAPPYRGHGLARRLLDRVVADAAARGATHVEAYPLKDGEGFSNFRGKRPMYDAAGFRGAKERTHDTVVRRDV